MSSILCVPTNQLNTPPSPGHYQPNPTECSLPSTYNNFMLWTVSSFGFSLQFRLRIGDHEITWDASTSTRHDRSISTNRQALKSQSGKVQTICDKRKSYAKSNRNQYKSHATRSLAHLPSTSPRVPPGPGPGPGPTRGLRIGLGPRIRLGRLLISIYIYIYI